MPTDSRAPWTDYMLDLARAASTRATCPRLRVGAVLTLMNRILASGYNGAPAGSAHCTDVGCRIQACPAHGEHCVRVVHAERNAWDQLIWLGVEDLFDRADRAEMVLYCTHEPCPACKIYLQGKGVVNFVWSSNGSYAGSAVPSAGEGHCSALH